MMTLSTSNEKAAEDVTNDPVRIETPVGFFDDSNVLSKRKDESVGLGISRPVYDSDCRHESQQKDVLNPYALSPISIFGSKQQEPSSNDDEASTEEDQDRRKEEGDCPASERPPMLSSYFNEADDSPDSSDREVTEISPKLLSALALLHADHDDEVDSLDDGSSTADSEDSFSRYPPSPVTSSPRKRRALIKRLLRFSKFRSHKTKKRMGITPASYEASLDAPLSFTGKEFAVSNDRAASIHPVTEVQKHSCSLSVSTMDHSSQDTDFTMCFSSVSEGCSWDANRVELLMPRFDAESLHFADHDLVESILRPWQVAFLSSIGITLREQLVQARETQEADVVNAMAKWRHEHNMTSFKKSQYALALHIWARACRKENKE